MALIPASAADGDQQVLCLSSISGAVSAGDYIYSSPSWCQTQCSQKGKFPYYALKNGGECYCLKSKPSGQTGTCNVPCKGFGTMNCGGSNSYGVFANPDVPDTGSSDSDTNTQSTTSTPSTSAPSTGSTTDSTTSTSEDSTTDSTTPSSTSSPTTSPSSTTTNPPSKTDDTTAQTTSAPPSTYTLIYTASTSGNSVVTITQTSSIANPTSSASAASASSSSSANSSQKKSSTNVGAIVGGVVGGVGGALVIALMAFFFIRWRRQAGDDDDDDYEYGPEKFDDGPTLGRGNTAKGSKRSRNGALDMPMTNPFDHPSDAHAVGGVRPPALPDPRLNPVMMGRRRLSEGSLADDADYSRKILHVANPE
ncbi:hypothetical protein DIURU_005570 [Diutina rugosa]|uniref:WSC domain-containing protein n=1 Tax=Diutina rugosa TaxID=5481 RepID=A0A642UCS1_DIURU|nr:uncharacterized protein DIURU_005570 [Diutina rugosa]KAA8896830.1 hypothetical protein DIURU_005570 [Diutina rugosa]